MGHPHRKTARPDGPKPGKRLERLVKRDIRRALNTLEEGIFFPYNPYGGKPGVSDTLGLFRGKFVAIEAKRSDRVTEKNGGVSFVQRGFGKVVLNNGGVFIVAYSAADVKGALAKEFGIPKWNKFIAEYEKTEALRQENTELI